MLLVKIIFALRLSADGVVITFADGHQRQLPCLTSGPFRYQEHAEQYVRAARQCTNIPVKQAVIAPSALSLLYPASGIDGYSREKFLEDVVDGAEADIRGCLPRRLESTDILALIRRIADVNVRYGWSAD